MKAKYDDSGMPLMKKRIKKAYLVTAEGKSVDVLPTKAEAFKLVAWLLSGGYKVVGIEVL